MYLIATSVEERAYTHQRKSARPLADPSLTIRTDWRCLVYVLKHR